MTSEHEAIAASTNGTRMAEFQRKQLVAMLRDYNAVPTWGVEAREELKLLLDDSDAQAKELEALKAGGVLLTAEDVEQAWSERCYPIKLRTPEWTQKMWPAFVDALNRKVAARVEAEKAALREEVERLRGALEADDLYTWEAFDHSGRTVYSSSAHFSQSEFDSAREHHAKNDKLSGIRFKRYVVRVVESGEVNLHLSAVTAVPGAESEGK